MRPIRKRRLQLVILLLVGVGITTAIALTALQQNLNLFYSPAQIVAGEVEPGTKIRAGGLVVPGSVTRDPNSLMAEFQVTDYSGFVTIRYNGILPDLFAEGQGIIAVGELDSEMVVTAEQVLAKHDEEYMPPEVAKAIEEAGHPAGSSL
jgi:cytochrome c-type biogenesis protein CcmE